MVCYEIKNTKNFMGQLFAGNLFDDFYVTECEINTVTQFSITGKYSKGWQEDLEDSRIYCTWSQIKQIVYNVIRGSKSPSYMKIVFSQKDVIEDFCSGIITLKFEDMSATLVTGFASTTFTLDKTEEKEWDKNVENLLIKQNIEIK